MKKIIAIIVAALMTIAASATTDSTAVGRKKVAVVLSGGGAKGMAHIGVLKVLEKAGIPIDIITGTSMGSIVGGLYAIGYNAHSLDSIVRMQDWAYIVTDKEDLSRQSYNDLRKQNTYSLSMGLTMGKRSKKVRPDLNSGGIIKGKNLAELFQHICSGYTDSLDFSHDLLIPFACVATNIVDNTEVVFHSGRLPQAMRASMSIPAAFSPVRIGDMVLLDGGLKNNFPVDVAREMGADIVIGVTLQGAAKTADEMGSTMSIISKIVEVNCRNKYYENIADADLHMQVNTTGYSTASFSAVAIDTLIQRGEEEALRHWDEIIALKKQIGIDDSFRPVIHHPLRPQAMTDKQHVVAFTFENMTEPAERFIRQKFHLNRTDSIDATLEQALTTSMRIDLFYRTAECRLEPEGDGVRVILSAGERKNIQLHAGIRYDTEDYAAVLLGLDVPLRTATPVNADFTFRLGKRLMLRGELTVHPRSFTRPTISYTFFRNDVDVYIEGDRDYSILYNQSQCEFLPFNFDIRHFNLQMGLRWDYMHYRNKLGAIDATPLTLSNEHYFSYRARTNFSSEDNWYFPTKGSRFKAEYAYLTDNFAQLDGAAGMSDVSADWRMSFTLGRRFTLQPMLYGRLLFGSNLPQVFYNTIGGDWFNHYVEQQMPFAGIGHMEYIRNHFVAAQLQAQQRIGQKHYVLLRVAAAENADKLRTFFDYRTLMGAQLAYYYSTMFGPMGVTLGYSNHTKHPYLFLNLGYAF